ncbi:transaldolase [Besnoitia besnoiti]|uniref:transaldolase n=1 Tax=Besnoitia besnoiti TaxID=94643 RepID=A0A2A9MBS9_BESBE|nr:transaldolase [Besnoitia besnoiti]PFH33133.1 transaldolase [Besnoitia besnoiti]
MSNTKKRAGASDQGAPSPAAKLRKTEENNVHENSLEALRKLSVVVADTGDFESLKKYLPQDATTNPSLLLKAASMPQYAHLMDKAIEDAKKVHAKSEVNSARLEEVIDQLFVAFGVEILKIVPGVVSTEVSAALSFDVDASVAKARKLIQMYAERGIEKERVLIKLATTWEGCEAAKILEKEGIHCNMTLLFSFAQAVAAAEARATLISPFAGRILDWYKKNYPERQAEFVGDKDPGVQTVKRIYNYYKKHNYPTTVMAASFRNIGEIIALAGCDKVTVAPALLEELKSQTAPVPRALSPEAAGHSALADSQKNSLKVEREAAKAHSKSEDVNGAQSASGDEEKLHLDEKAFRWLLNEDAMATEKLAEGIRSFSKDLITLKNMVREKLVMKGTRA